MNEKHILITRGPHAGTRSSSSPEAADPYLLIGGQGRREGLDIEEAADRLRGAVAELLDFEPCVVIRGDGWAILAATDPKRLHPGATDDPGSRFG